MPLQQDLLPGYARSEPTVGMKRLIVLPINPGSQSGYEIAVAADLRRLRVTAEDVVVIYEIDNKTDYANVVTIPRPGKFTSIRLRNAVRGMPSLTLAAKQLEHAVNQGPFDEVFCGEVFFYPALRKLLPDTRLTVRLHNFFALTKTRQACRKYPLDKLFKMNLACFSKLELQVAADPNVRVLFITEQEHAYGRLLYPSLDAEVWGVQPDSIKTPTAPSQRQLIWFGSISAHKRYSVIHFTQQVLPPLRAKLPDVVCHLYGRGTLEFHNPAAGVYGHGFYDGEGLPHLGEGLYINPDLLGGGAKIKVGEILRHGGPIISTPFGMEGAPIVDSKHLLIAEIDAWEHELTQYFTSQVIG